MKIGIAYALPHRQVWIDVVLPDGATIQDAIERSGILKQVPEINLEQQKVGIFSKISKLDTVLNDGDRVEIYRPITCDPKTIPRKAKAGDAASEAEAG
ncbi:MAG: protein RnfH [Gallionellales bacterium RIFCSPLOWO2_02_FULL_57_47]|nr:MAG: protein RnfH [Gallionellales bacterium RIFCSPLOWO2_02_FULL_57_47]OGT09130.1 MAG: protein RnfH [Gallionellales bacterium RIFCSPHIGHO2_02_FULL_57_16]